MALSVKGRHYLEGYLRQVFLEMKLKIPDEKIVKFLCDPETAIMLEKTFQQSWREFYPKKPNTLHQIQNLPDPVAPIDQLQPPSQNIGQSPAPKQISMPLPTPPRTSVAPMTPPAFTQPQHFPTPPKPTSSTNAPMPPQKTLQPTLAFRLANGKSGVDYQCKLELVTQNAPIYKIKSIEVPSLLGLIGDGILEEVFGKPTKDGDFQVKVWYSIGDSDLAQSTAVTLVINPDPKSLWKDLPSNNSDPYWKPDVASMTISGESVLMVAASKRGRSHAHVGSFRDDDFYLAYLPEDCWHIAIVSDGAGSAKFSRRGSQIICNEGGARLQELLEGGDGTKLIQAVESLNAAREIGAASDGLERQVQNLLYTTIGYTAHHVTKLLQDECKIRTDLGGVFKDYSSTAIISLMRKFPFGVLCAAYWVGDGAVGILKGGSVPTLLGEADSGEYSGQTRFIDPVEVTQEALMKRIRFELTTDFQAMLLMTDGVSDPFFETESNLTNPAKWSALWEDVSLKANLGLHDQNVGQRVGDWLDFWSAGNHDDRTLAAIY